MYKGMFQVSGMQHAAKFMIAGVTAGTLALAGAAQAQVVVDQPIERNPAPVPPAPAPTVAQPVKADPDADDSPFGIQLTGITLTRDAVTGGQQARGPAALAAIDTSRTGDVGGVSRVLERHVGQQLSRKRIAEIKADIANAWRRSGHPFVHLSVPEQDLSGGRLTIIVDEFRLGDTKTRGAGVREADLIGRGIRLRAGDRIDALELGEDLEWLNRYPFRRVEAVFAAGKAPGTSDVTYTVRRDKPWRAGAGFANSGSPRTGMDRAFIYAMAALPVAQDAWVSYQLTTSGPRIASLGEVPSGARRYVSHSLQAALPFGARAAIDLSLADIRSSQPVEAFDIRQHTREYALTVRSALSNLVGALPGELRAGVSWKQQRGRLLFGSVVASTPEYDVGQLEIGYSWHAFDSRGDTGLDAAVRFSPGGIGRRNSDAVYDTASQHNFARARYAYAAGSLFRHTQFSGFSLSNTLTWQIAGTRLPQTEQIGLGGVTQVRGYTSDDGAFDRAVVLRNELRLDALRLDKDGAGGTLQPYAYLDGGYAGKAHGPAARIIGAAGLGLDARIAGHLLVSADGGFALSRLGYTKRGDARANVRVTASF